jgi:4-amino-4-deoxy-L-arabinose transferase-like glycosyltransferase
MFLGPLYYYLMIPSLAATNLSPVGPAIAVAGFGILTVALVWWVGRQWFGRKEALLATLLYSVSPTVINYSKSSWNPNILPFFSLLAKRLA